MGLILDSTAAIGAEREGKNARQLLETIAFRISNVRHFQPIPGLNIVSL